MEQQQILSQIQEIFRETLDNESITLFTNTTANDIEEWDSLTHIQLIVQIEKHFNIRFSSKEILSWKNVGEMIDSLMKK